MNHYKQDHPLYNVQGHANLFVKDADNVMFNQFTAYILSEFPKMQNMKSFAVHEQTDIDEFVRESRILPDGTEVYRFSKELIAYLETIVAFSPYYRVNDPRMVGPLDQYFADAVAAYAEVSYKTFHKKLAREMKTWYERFPAVPPEPQTDDEGLPLASAALPAEGTQVRPAQRCFNMEDEDDEGETPQEETAALHQTDPASGAASPAPAAAESAATTGTKKA